MVSFNVATVALAATAASSGLSTYQPTRRSPDEFDWDTLKPRQSLHFSPCYEEFECARLIVPLDWTQPDAELRRSSDDRTMTLALTRLRANMTGASSSAATHGGTVIVNPGGPGDSGTVEMLKNGHYLRDLFSTDGKRFDVLSFDPRGMGFSTPTADCFAGEEAARSLFDAQMMGSEAGSPVRGDDRAETIAAQRALSRALGARCNLPGEDGYVVQEYVGTASVARDMLLMVDELEKLHVKEKRSGKGEAQKTLAKGNEEKLPRLQYFGTSYGTMLGNTFVSMFPGRVKRMILDGNVVPEDYMAGDWVGNIADTSKVLNSFYKACFAARSSCALYDEASDKSPATIRSKVDALTAQLDAEPLIIAGKGLVPTIVKGIAIRSLFADPMYDPLGGYTRHATTLAEAIAGNYTRLLAAASVPVADTCANATAAQYRWMGQANVAVRCGDGADLRNTTVAEWRAQLKRARELSPEWADLWMDVTCLEWPMRAHWRFEGSFGSPAADAREKQHNRPSAPVLFLASRYDPATPMRSSVAAARGHAGARLVVQNTDGHCATLSAPSACTKRIVGRYMATGEMPDEGTECEGDCKPFKDCPYLRMVLPR